MQNAIGHRKCHLFQFAGQIDTHDTDTRRDAEGHRREVHNSTNSSRHQLVGDFLGMRRRNRQHPKLDLFLRDDFDQSRKRPNFHPVDHRTRLAGIRIKRGDNPEPLLDKSPVAKQRTAQIADADECHAPFAVGPQNYFDRTDQFLTAIANPRMAKVPEMGQIFTNLGIGKAQLPAELAAADCLFAIGDQVLQFPQIEAQPAHYRFRNRTRIRSG